MGQTGSTLAILGGPRTLPADADHKDLFRWPIVTAEDEQAVLEVLRSGAMSGTGVTRQFEEEFAAWMGVRHALGCCNGTAAILGATWACGVGAGDEIIAPSLTYWASATQALQLGASVNFADVDPDTLCIDPRDIEHRIGPRTRLIVVVHYAAHPCDMDPIMAIARRHGVKVLEDASHAVGTLYKGRKAGTIGDIAAMSMMTGKGFAIGEAGMTVTNDRGLYERCIAYGHYERTGVSSNFNPVDAQVHDASLTRFAGVPLGGAKHRMNQTCAAMGRVQLRHYDRRMAEIQSAMNRFWDLLEGVPGLRAHRPAAGSQSTMGSWYFPRGLYRAEELDGLPCGRFCEAVRAEGVGHCGPGANRPLHLHPVFHEADIFAMGRPTMVSFGQRDVRQGPGSLPVTENTGNTVLSVPWFKHDDPDIIARYADAYRKVALQADRLLRASRPE
ncbi:MAG: DegT/DnrJ/EryC1/StrS family aminotransferase [Planctomycetes bacterium]|nr:DegT/DnrJ/EryC1/StrS family aminotransferase [Planctomycetota bacterium]